MISYADDDTAATVSDWFDCADAFLLGRMTAKLAIVTKQDRANFAEPATPAQHGVWPRQAG